MLSLSADLARGAYTHGDYHHFYVRDPKYRQISKATVRDRVAHQAFYDIWQPLFEKKFFFDSYSSRPEKGTMRAIARLLAFIRKAKRGGRQEAWIFHGDVDDFFGSIDHEILLVKIAKTVKDPRYFNIAEKIIKSFSCSPGKGLPLGNLTSQLFANIYLHELDYFVKQKLGIRPYIRYNDDFFVVARNREELVGVALKIKQFLSNELQLGLPPNKIKIKPLSRCVDVLGTVIFPWGEVPRSRLRTAAERTVALATKNGYTEDRWRGSVSYLGFLSHTRSFFLREKLRLAQLS